MNETETPNPDDTTVDASKGATQPPKDLSPGQPFGEIPLSESSQTVIGRFRLLEKIGEGGFGVVYVAEQKTPVKRRVALKIIKLGMDTRSVVARFEAERQALAMMDHPNIAKVFDAGATDTGRPYFVMELVRGISITDYCDQNNLPPIQRLGLFINVCHAIQHAHQKGVIHRDIKPSNILVTLHDGVPIPKVIDFGIAKATQGDLTDKTIYTQLQQFIGTPAYMSPEQAEMSGLDVDTRSDIYSLGVLLYELLTGTTPFDAKELMKAGMDEMRRQIRETEPVRPSNRLSGMTGADSTGTAKRRGMEASKLVGLLRGDLDWVVMKCLEKDRTRRYETANGVALDIQRYMNNEPITARPPSRIYRLQKSIRRNKLGFFAAAAVLLTLLLGIIATSLGLSWALRERAVAEQERAAAQTQAARSAQVAQAMKDMLADVRPNVFKGMDTKLLRAVLDQTSQRLSTSLSGQPEVEADLRQILGKVYADLDDPPSAEAMFSQALRLRKQTLGDESLSTAEAMDDYANALDIQNKHAEALAMARAGLAMRRKLLGEDNLVVATSLQTLGAILRRHGGQNQAEGAESETVLREALALRRKLPGARPTDVADTLTSLGLLIMWSRPDEGIECQREALALRRQALGDDDPTVANSLDHLGEALSEAGKFSEAEAVERQALAMQTRLLDPDNRRLSLTRTSLGITLRYEGKLSEAETQLRAATDRWMKRPNWERDQNAIRTIDVLEGTLAQEGKPDEVCSLAEACLNAARLKLDPGDPGMVSILNSAAWSFYMAGRLVEALPLADELLKAVRAQPTANSSRALGAIDTVARIDEATGRLDQAVPLLEETVAGKKATDGSNDPNTLDEMQELGQAYQEAGRLADSQQLLEETLRLYKTNQNSETPDAAFAQARLGLTLIREGKFDEAESPLRSALAICSKSPGLFWASYTQSLLGEALVGQKKYADAEPLLLQGYRGMKEKQNQTAGNRAKTLMDAAERLVALYTAWGKPESAAQWTATVNSLQQAVPTTNPSP